MGYNISQLKAQYYRTHDAISNYFTFLHFYIQHEDTVNLTKYYDSEIKDQSLLNIKQYEEYMKNNVYKLKKDWYKIPKYDTYKFQKDVIKNGINIDKYTIDNSYANYTSVKTSIFDLWAGEGLWLNNIKKYYNHKEYNNDIYSIKTLGIELVKERANKLKENQTDYFYNSASEDVKLPPNSCSLLLFNPPYFNESNELRATKKYLLDIIDSKILCENTSMVDFVIREDDFRDCLDLLLDHFSIVKDTIAKAPSDEFSKFKQVVFTARFKYYKALPLNTNYDIVKRQREKQEYIDILDNIKEINLNNISDLTFQTTRALYMCDFDKMIESIQLQNNNSNKISNNNNMVWNWFKELTDTNTKSFTNITVPKELKKGEIVNIISSGFINGQINNHVISGGTKQVEETIKSIQLDSNGKERETIEVRRINKPFLNVLLPNGKIKKLLNKDVN